MYCNAETSYRDAVLSAYMSMVSCSSKPVGSPTMWRSGMAKGKGSLVAVLLR